MKSRSLLLSFIIIALISFGLFTGCESALNVTTVKGTEYTAPSVSSGKLTDDTSGAPITKESHIRLTASDYTDNGVVTEDVDVTEAPDVTDKAPAVDTTDGNYVTVIPDYTAVPMPPIDSPIIITPIITNGPLVSDGAPVVSLLPDVTIIPNITTNPGIIVDPDASVIVPPTTDTPIYFEVPALSAPQIPFDEIADYSGSPYIEINSGIPYFYGNQLTDKSYEFYSELDSLGRCGVAVACIGLDLMPTSPRGDISSVKPTGWHSVQYSIVDGGSLYNRSHLIGFQLSGENANRKNLITGTRYFNATGMLPFENMIADYVKETGNHVLYRVTPFFEGQNLVASGAFMEALSIEDGGEGVCFNVYVYNVQPGVIIDYLTGESELENPPEDDNNNLSDCDYVLNKKSKKFHDPECSSVPTIKETNKEEFKGTREELIEMGYSPCGNCKP